ncbi:metal-dependent hydrolase [Amphibacillus sp. MSJ-3]|uniref:metal-dependent hydrolase n=1 Tax=Amphibacillus sp. MSJ-3 TaxID=2841505 RepID=UPI001C0F049C|nr:metal-dependent hydrolase [Amphibacillus sp. MSJ-3]MBU5595650.1 metal-dependent hydrolase [Amphibacillus sp. MSJ-3]
MDTGTHIAMGIALGGIATIDPVVQQNPIFFGAIMTGTIIGSHAPDFDTILKLKNNAVYLRHHRGITHSIPLMIFWGLLISSIIHFFVPELPFLNIWGWTTLAVSLHIFVDLFNAYGTQAFRPFTNKWIGLGFINTFDPVIFSAHIIGIIIWILGADPAITFITIYCLLFFYYLKRYWQKKVLERKIRRSYSNIEGIFTSPTINQKIWRLAVTTKDKFYVARAIDGNIQIVDVFDRKPLPNNEFIRVAKSDPNVSAFLSFSKVYRWELTEGQDYTEVRFIDLRYRSKDHYPFVAVVKITKDYQILKSYTGWVFSEQKLQDKLLIEDI